MTQEELREWVAGGEGPSVEFKREFTTEIARDIAAFANGGGGILLIGVDDDASVLGVSENPRRIEERVMGLCSKALRPSIIPQVDLVTVDGRQVMVLSVAQGFQRPYTANDICYVRAGSTSRRASPDELRRLALNAVYTEFERMAVREATLGDLDLIQLTAYVEHRSPGAISVNGLDLGNVAVSLGLARKSGLDIFPSVAGLLLFGKHPQLQKPPWGVGAIKVSGTDLSDPIVDRADLEGPVEKLLEDGLAFVRRNMRIAGVFDEQRDPATRMDVPEYPLTAVREVITNALVHRDYSLKGRIALRLFDDCLKVFNPGGLPGDLTLEQATQEGGRSLPRNPILARTMRERGKMEEVGRGLIRIRREMERLGSEEPSFEAGEACFQVTLPSRHRTL